MTWLNRSEGGKARRPSGDARTVRRFLILVGATALGVTPAAAQRGDPHETACDSTSSNPLDRVVAEALRANLGLQQARVSEERAEAGVREARGRFLPSLTMDSRYTRQSGTLDLGDFVNPVYATLNQITGEDRFPTDLSLTLPMRHDSHLGLVLPVLNAPIWAGYAASRHAAEAEHQNVLTAARQLAAQAQSAFLSVAAARSVRRTWESALPLVVESERVAQRRVDAGTATPDAVFRARAERSEVEQKLQEAREAEDAAARAFNRLLNRPLDAPVDTIPETALRLPLDLTEDEAVQRALARREELSGVRAATRAAEAAERAVTGAFLPSVAVAVDYGFQGQDVRFDRSHDYWTASVVVSWNLFNGGQDAARREAARADVRRLDLRGGEVENMIRLDARQAYDAAVVARDAVATADSRLAAARRTFQLVRRRYEEGLAAPIEFIDARTALTSAELNRVLTVYRYAIRWVDLERAAALLDIERLEAQS